MKAKKELLKYPNLKIIGITGSYGKTAVKENLKLILSKKYKVVATEANINTAVGIAQTINQYINDKTEIFIAEIGAYKKGEIKKAVDLCPLDIAIVNNVGKAHIEIFGSVSNTALAKFEIIEGLKKSGFAILNGDNTYTKNMAQLTDKKSIFFTIDSDTPDEKNDTTLEVKNVLWNESHVTFDIIYKDAKESLETKVIGQHQFPNIIPALLCSLELGFKINEIKDYLKEFTFQSPHFKVYPGVNKSKIIDDGYNTNPEGFDAALEFLKQQTSENKVILTKGIPEIGEEMKNIYQSLSEKIISFSTTVITTDNNLFKAIQKTDPTYSAILAKDNEEINNLIVNYLTPDTTILVEGRVNPETIELLKKKQVEI